MRIRYYSHATLQLIGRTGVRLLTNPWRYSPVYGNMLWQFPPCRVPLKEYVDQDVLYLAHTHPDYFCPRTLQHFDRAIPIVIRKYDWGVSLRDELRDMGFATIIEVRHRETVSPLPGLTLTLLSDRKTFVSALVASDGERTVFCQNNCFLPEQELQWVGEHFQIDLACLFFMGRGQFPGAFEMSGNDKEVVGRKKIEWSFERGLRTAMLLKTSRAIPYAADLTWLRRPDLAGLDEALPVEFRKYVGTRAPGIEVFLLSSGETYGFRETPADYHSYFKTRDEVWKEYEVQRSLPETVRVIRELEAKEESYTFDPTAFQQRFQDYCNYAQTLRIVREPDEGLRVGLRVQGGGSSSIEYVLRYEPTVKDIVPASKPLAEDKGIHMVLTVQGNLLGMAMAGALTFEDLSNCRYTITRPGPFTEAEDSFWSFLEGFSWYLQALGRRSSGVVETA